MGELDWIQREAEVWSAEPNYAFSIYPLLGLGMILSDIAEEFNNFKKWDAPLISQDV